MSMRITIVGCSGSFPDSESACSSYLIEVEDFKLLVDFGSGSLGSLQRHIDPHELDAIIITHLHADHFMDACPYVVMRRYGPGSPYPVLPLYGPTGTEARIAVSYGGVGETACPHLTDVYDFRVLKPGTFMIGPISVTTDVVAHPVETYGLRLEYEGRSLAYSSDTGPCDAVERLAQNVDVFLCEASYLEGRDNPAGVHMTGREAGEAATRAGAGRLLLTHLVRSWGSEKQTLAEATSVFAGQVDVVHPGDQYII